MAELNTRLDFMFYMKGISSKSGMNIVGLYQKYGSWELEAYMANPPSCSMIKRVRKIYEEVVADM